jgi:hypothetical protein
MDGHRTRREQVASNLVEPYDSLHGESEVFGIKCLYLFPDPFICLRTTANSGTQVVSFILIPQQLVEKVPFAVCIFLTRIFLHGILSSRLSRAGWLVIRIGRRAYLEERA